jgi:hypothetical protein
MARSSFRYCWITSVAGWRGSGTSADALAGNSPVADAIRLGCWSAGDGQGSRVCPVRQPAHALAGRFRSRPVPADVNSCYAWPRTAGLVPHRHQWETGTHSLSRVRTEYRLPTHQVGILWLIAIGTEPCLLCDVNSVPRGTGTVPIWDTHRQQAEGAFQHAEPALRMHLEQAFGAELDEWVLWVLWVVCCSALDW